MSKRNRQKKRQRQPSEEEPTKTRHYFFLNPYDDAAFTKCPKCNTKTMARKIPFVIHIEPQQVFVLNLSPSFYVHIFLSVKGTNLFFHPIFHYAILLVFI